MPEPTQGVATASSAPWVISVLTLVLTIAWNFANRRHTNKLADKIRSDNFALEQWNRVHDKLETCLDALSEAISELALASGKTFADRKIKCEELLRTVILKQDFLAQALQLADENSYIDDAEWQALANGTSHGSETSWDQILAIGDEVRKATTHAKVNAALSSCKKWSEEICEPIRKRMRVETIQHDPANKAKKSWVDALPWFS
jgi:hypothetical protein